MRPRQSALAKQEYNVTTEALEGGDWSQGIWNPHLG